MCGKLKPGNCVISTVVSEEIRRYLDLVVREGSYKTLSKAAGAILTEVVEERLSNGMQPYQRQDEDCQEHSDKAIDNPKKNDPTLDKETFNKLPKSYQIFSKLLEEANNK